jgi:RimJ/RimL family protein N-acetyltransferase
MNSRIETERLILRLHELTDFPLLKIMWEDPTTTRYTIGKPSTEQQSWARLMNYRGHWALMNYGYWAVEEKSSGKYIGDIGFADFKRDMTPSIEGIPELGWCLAQEFRGKGYATEALRVAINWGKIHLPSKSIACIISPANKTSLRVAEKCGFTTPQTAQYLGEETILYFQNLN